jgi:hypothetical protein
MKKKDCRQINSFDDDDVDFLTDLLMETNLSISEIAKELNISINEVNKKINHNGLSWVKKGKRKMSRGQSSLTDILKKIVPGEEVINEFHLGDRLMLDIYCPAYNLGIEYHGRQHFFYTKRFFDSKYEFIEAQKRDEKKVELCKEKGIILIVFRYNDSLTEESVYSRIIDAIRSFDGSGMIESGTKSKISKTSEFYNDMKKKNSEYRKKKYKELKEKRNNDLRRG